MSGKAWWGQPNYLHVSKLPWHGMELGLISFQHTAHIHIVSFDLYNKSAKTILFFLLYN